MGKIECQREIDSCNFCAYFGDFNGVCTECIKGNSLHKQRIVTDTEIEELMDRMGKVHLCYGHYVAISNTLKIDYSI